MRLYEIAEAYRAWESEVEQNEGEITHVLAGLLTEINEERDKKVENIAKLIQELRAEQKALKSESDRMAARSKSVGTRVDWLTRYAQDTMAAMGIDHIDGELLKIRIQQNPPSCEIISEEAVPEKYIEIVTVKKVNKRAIIADWKQDGMIPAGCDITQGKSLRIR